MIRARQLGALLLLAHVAFAQTATNIPAPPVVNNMSVSKQDAEVRIDVNANAVVTSANVSAVYGDRIVLDMPGVVYNISPRRILVNKNGVHAVRIWQQTENPPLTRMLIELDRTLPYVLSSEGNSVVLRIGTRLKEPVQRASKEPSQPARHRDVASLHTGRTSPAATAAEAVIGVFRRGAKPPRLATAELTPPTPPPPQSFPPFVLARTEEPAPPKVDPNKESNFSIPVETAPPAPDLSANNLSVVSPESQPSTLTSAAAPAETPAPPTAAAEMPKPDSDALVPDMRAVTESVNTGMRTAFQVKHVQDETAYLDGGRSAGLSEGMMLVIKEDNKASAEDGTGGSTGGTIAQLIVIGVAETSAVTEIRTPKRDVVPGDLAYLSSLDTQALVDQHTMGATRKYPAVITFTESDLLDEEARAFVPRAPLPSVNRMRGRIGMDYMGTINRDASRSRSSDIGVVFRADFTRIGGTYWNLGGYWRGRINSFSSSSQQTLQDKINRTYHLELTYQNPNSHWVAGIGRMYLPWASSLDTIDGAYLGRRISKTATLGVFGGSAPDPTSWNYNPDQRLGGSFINFEGGSFEGIHYTSTSGAGVSLLKWQMQKPFAFFENTISYKRVFSIYHALQADRPQGNPAVAPPSAGISQSFFTARFSPASRIEFSFNHTFFRNIPTFDPTLIGTGLLDKYLFQGMSAGVRVEVIKQITLYTDLGQSSRSGDAKHSLNQLYGITFGKVPWVGLHADAHYSKFSSSFGDGTYRAISISRSFGDAFRLDLLGGNQSVVSALAGNQSARFVTASADTSLGSRFFLQGGLTFYRGQLQNYDQWYFTLGYRFDSKGKHR